MQVPTRRAQLLKNRDEDAGANQLTVVGLMRLKDELKRLEQEQPAAVEEVDRTRQFGDFSENAEYQDAKFRLRRINDRIFTLKERIRHAIVIDEQQTASDHVILGSTVVVHINTQLKEFHIVGPRESNPSRGRISHLSPVGSALLNHRVGDQVTVQTDHGNVIYTIVEIK